MMDQINSWRVKKSTAGLTNRFHDRTFDGVVLTGGFADSKFPELAYLCEWRGLLGFCGHVDIDVVC